MSLCVCLGVVIQRGGGADYQTGGWTGSTGGDGGGRRRVCVGGCQRGVRGGGRDSRNERGHSREDPPALVVGVQCN